MDRLPDTAPNNLQVGGPYDAPFPSTTKRALFLALSSLLLLALLAPSARESALHSGDAGGSNEKLRGRRLQGQVGKVR